MVKIKQRKNGKLIKNSDDFVQSVNFDKTNDNYVLTIVLKHKDYAIDYFGGTNSEKAESFSVGVDNNKNKNVYEIEIPLPKGMRTNKFSQFESVRKNVLTVLFYKNTLLKKKENMMNYENGETKAFSEMTNAEIFKYEQDALKRLKQGKIQGLSKKNYIKFSETNDNEGETWHFYVESTNPKAKELQVAIDAYMKDAQFEEYSYAEVKESEMNMNLKRKSATYYMPEYNKCKDIKDVPTQAKNETEDQFIQKIGEFLYKGCCFIRK